MPPVSCRVKFVGVGEAASDRVSAGVSPESPRPGFTALRDRVGAWEGTDELIERVRYPHWRPIRGYSSVG